MAYFPPAMSFRRVRVLFTLALFSSASTLPAQTVLPHAESGPNERPMGLVVLRNGEILEGQLQTAKNDRVTVRLERGEISLRQAEVDVIASSLDDAYALKLAKVPPTDIEGHLDLAAWCVRHGLLGNAAAELATAVSIQPRHPRIALVQRRLQRIIEQQQVAQQEMPTEAETNLPESVPQQPIPLEAKHAEPSPAATAVWPPRKLNSSASENQEQAPLRTAIDKDKTSGALPSKRAHPRDTITEIERLVRTLPSDAVESFTSLAQPILVNGCATAGCHAPGNVTTFTLLRLPPNRSVSRRLTQRNLYNVVQLVNFKKPAESALFAMAKEPHGPLKTPALGEAQTAAYRELVGWVATLTRSNLDEMLPVESTEQQPAVVHTRPAAGSARQSLMRRMRAPTVSTRQAPRVPIVNPRMEQAGAIIGTSPKSTSAAGGEIEPQSNDVAGNISELAPAPTNVNQAVGVPPPSTTVAGTTAVPSANDVQTLTPVPSHGELAAPIGQTPPPPPALKVRTPNPNGVTAVDRFLALRGAPRVAKEIQTAPKTPTAAGTVGLKQQTPPSDPDQYDLMRFVKEK